MGPRRGPAGTAMQPAVPLRLRRRAAGHRTVDRAERHPPRGRRARRTQALGPSRHRVGWQPAAAPADVPRLPSRVQLCVHHGRTARPRARADRAAAGASWGYPGWDGGAERQRPSSGDLQTGWKVAMSSPDRRVGALALRHQPPCPPLAVARGDGRCCTRASRKTLAPGSPCGALPAVRRGRLVQGPDLWARSRTKPTALMLTSGEVRGASPEDPDLGVERRSKLEWRDAGPLEIGVEEAVHAVRRHGKLATSIDADDAGHAQRPEL